MSTQLTITCYLQYSKLLFHMNVTFLYKYIDVLNLISCITMLSGEIAYRMEMYLQQDVFFIILSVFSLTNFQV